MGTVLGFGLLVEDLPGSWPSPEGEVRDRIRWSVGDGSFEPGAAPMFQEVADGLIVRFDDEGEYRVRRMPEARVEAVLGPADEASAALSFVLAVLPLSVPLFGLEPFHGSALEVGDGRALMVLGYPEAGKSTTAAALRSSGLRFLTDDACAIDADGSLWPGPPMLAVRAGGPNASMTTYDGKVVTTIPDHTVTPRPVAASVVLRSASGAALGVSALDRRDAISSLLEQVRSPWVMPVRRQRAQFRAAATLAGKPVGAVFFDKAKHPPAQVAEVVTEWMASL